MSTKSYAISVTQEGKNMILAYVLWWFLGWAGVHRFYLGKTQSGLAQLALSVIGGATAILLIGYVFLGIWGIWWMMDAYFVQKYVHEANHAAGLSASGFTINSAVTPTDTLSQLERLHALLVNGAISQEEFEQAKAKLLD